MLRKALITSILTAAVLSAQVVEGRVVNTATGGGIPNVSIGLLAMGQTAYKATTDATGRFRIENVQEGSYTPFYQAANFRQAHDGSGGTVRVTAGAEPVRLEYEMAPVSRISGRVLDAAGNPVANAELKATQGLQGGSTMMAWPANEKGEYRSPEMMQPGEWTVSAMAPSSWKPPEPRDGQRLGWTQTFYPGVTDPELAVKVEVPPGGEVSNLDIKLAAAPVYRIRGILLDAHGDPAPKAVVELNEAMGLAPLGPRRNTGVDGAFEFESVVDGEFRLSSTMNRDGIKQWVSQPVEVKGRDLEDVKLQLTLPFSLPEKIIMEVPEGAAKPPLPTVAMMAAGLGGRVSAAVTDGKGGLIVKNLYPDLYRIEAITPPPLYYLDSIRLGAMDIPAAGVQILSGDQPLIVTYKRNGGTVRGTIEDCPDCAVYLVPQDPTLRSFSFIRQTKCGKNGSFEIPDVRPGEYLGFAVAPDSRVPVSPANPDQNLINQSSRVSVRANESTDAEIRVVKR